MHCPFCTHPETKVIDSRLVSEGEQIRRRRECLTCNERFTTFEVAELLMPRVVKQDGNRQQLEWPSPQHEGHPLVGYIRFLRPGCF